MNHSKKGSNLHPKVVDVDGHPHIIFMASRDIVPKDELLYEYGERSRDIIDANPWLAH